MAVAAVDAVIVQTASRTNPLLQYQNIQSKSIIDMKAQKDEILFSKVLISDEVNEKVISMNVFNQPKQNDTEYPCVTLENGERFYFNRFVFL